jgi:hypothetical protein
MTTLTDPNLDETFYPIGEAVDPTVKALNRIATALEQLVLAKLDVTSHTTPAPGLSALPPVHPAQNLSDVCPIHNVPWKLVPAGISKKTGNEYSAFKACSTAGCDQRPPR